MSKLPPKPKLSKLKKNELIEFIKENNILEDCSSLTVEQLKNIIKNEYTLERRNILTEEFVDDSRYIVVVWNDFPKFTVKVSPHDNIAILKNIISEALIKKVQLNPDIPGFTPLLPIDIIISGHPCDEQTLHFIEDQNFESILITRKEVPSNKTSILVIGEDINKQLYFANVYDKNIRYAGDIPYPPLDLVLTSSSKYREIYVCDRKYNSFIQSLLPLLDDISYRSKIYLLDNDEEAYKEYGVLPTSKKIMNVGNEKQTFYGYMYVGVTQEDVDVATPATNVASQECNPSITTIDPTEIKVYKPKVSRNYNYIDVEPIDVNNEHPKFDPITFEQFRKLLDDDEFIKQYTLSVSKLLDDKKSFYKNKFDEAKKNFDVCQKKTMGNLRNIRVGGEDSMSRVYSSIMSSLTDKIELLNDINLTNIKSNLIDALDNTEFGLASMYGRDDIKNDICSGLYAFGKRYEYIRTTFMLNYVIMGPAGCGKTMLAQVIAYVLKKSGILGSGHLTMLTRGQTIGKYIGHTAPQVLEIMYNSLEGILFIDEAHNLSKPESYDSKDFGPEAISEIVNFEDKFIGGTHSTILVGYEKEMRSNTLSSNQGMNRRFPNQYTLEKYSISTLTDILISFIEHGACIEMSDEDANYIYSLLSSVPHLYIQNQSGDMLNLGAYLVKIITASYTVKWEDISNHKFLIRCGFEKFLAMKSKTL